MRSRFFIRIHEPGADAEASWLGAPDASGNVVVVRGALSDAAPLAAGAQVVVLIPSSRLLFTHAKVPTQNRQKLLKALPYALEDQLAEDVDDLHFALGARGIDGDMSIVVVSREQMGVWQEQLRTAGINSDYLIPDALSLPIQDQAWTVFLESNLALVRTGEAQGFASELDNLPAFLGFSVAEAGDATAATIDLWDNGATYSSQLTEVVKNAEIRVHDESIDLLTLVAREFDPRFAFNLLQGDYSRKEQWGKRWRPWRVAASLATVWVVLQLAMNISENVSLSRQNDELRAQVNRTYKEAFPEAKNVVNPKVQMQRKLAELQGGSKSGVGAGFLVLVATTGSALKATPGVNLRSVRYKNGELDVEIDVPSLQTLDQVKQLLGSQRGLAVELQSAASKDSKVEGRLHIKSVTL